ncbi:response regulator [Acaryochloris sp. CCMEE 5410]|uniref:response regulator n=1 Tax=Acaryochloris sp. CCMEE 5410 TaxID=310037 RepID=UPI0037BFC2AB
MAIVDLGLPDMDGIELVQRFKKSSTQTNPQNTKILILTMHHHATEVLAAFAAGTDSYCVKDTDRTNALTEITPNVQESHPSSGCSRMNCRATS